MRRKEKEKYYRAAKRMIQEEYLNYCISNPAVRQPEPVRFSRTMLYLKPCRKNTEGYVFDPAYGICIGRDKGSCDICLEDITVSARHCELFWYKGCLFLRDLNSQNGTEIKKGFFSHTLYGETDLLQNRERFKVGDTWFKVTVFYYDAAFE